MPSGVLSLEGSRAGRYLLESSRMEQIIPEYEQINQMIGKFGHKEFIGMVADVFHVRAISLQRLALQISPTEQVLFENEIGHQLDRIIQHIVNQKNKLEKKKVGPAHAE